MLDAQNSDGATLSLYTLGTTDLLYYLSGLSCFTNIELVTNLLVFSNPNQSNRRSAVLQRYSPYEVSVCSLFNEFGCQPNRNILLGPILALVVCQLTLRPPDRTAKPVRKVLRGVVR